jgi:cell division protein FtsI/penicillin-binding protein 2
LAAERLTAKLAAAAQGNLHDPLDAAAVMHLEDGRLLLEHHPEIVRQRPISPGSVLKLATAYALLEAGLEDLEHSCGGEHVDAFGHHRPCWLRPGHGKMRLRTALASSCNVWFYRASEELDWERLRATWASFGAGAPWPPGVKVVPDEIPHRLDPGDRADAAIGDHPALALTPLSLLRMVSVIATRGTRVTPIDSGPPLLEHQPLDRSLLELVALGMEEAVDGGTLQGRLPGAAAKTGTAKRDRARGTRGLVIGYWPRGAPRFAFVVVRDRGRGAIDAAPAAAAILEALEAE